MEELEVSRILVHADGLARIGGRPRVACRAGRHQGRVRDPACGLHARITIGRPGSARWQLFLGQAISLPFMGSAVDPQAGGRGAPAFEPGVAILPRSDTPARRGVALDVLDPALGLPLVRAR